MVLGELSVPPETMGFLAVLLFLATLGDRLLSVAQRFLGKGEKREVSFTSEYVSKTDFVELKDIVHKHEEYGKERRKEIYQMIRDLQKHADDELKAFRREVKEDINGVHERVTDVLSAVSEMSGKIEKRTKEI